MTLKMLKYLKFYYSFHREFNSYTTGYRSLAIVRGDYLSKFVEHCKKMTFSPKLTIGKE